MLTQVFSTTTLFLLVQSSFGSDVPKLTAANFEEKTDGKTVFIKAFAPWCGHCKAMAADWEALALEYKGHEVGLVAEIDCTEEDALCEKLGVQGFPTLFYGDPGDLEQYEGGRDLEAFKTFAEETITKPVCSLKKLDSCTDEQKKVVEDLRAKSKEELEEMLTMANSDIEALNTDFYAKVEELQATYEKMSADLQESLDEVKAKSSFKWLGRVFTEKGGVIPEPATDGMGDEL